MYILEHTKHEEWGDVFRLSDGQSVYVTDHAIGFVGGHPSSVDYYYEERGYGCQSAREAAIVFATQFPQFPQ